MINFILIFISPHANFSSTLQLKVVPVFYKLIVTGQNVISTHFWSKILAVFNSYYMSTKGI